LTGLPTIKKEKRSRRSVTFTGRKNIPQRKKDVPEREDIGIEMERGKR